MLEILSKPSEVEEVRTQKNDKTETPMDILEKSLNACGFGRFHYYLMLLGFLACVCNANVSAITSFILPDAECDLQLTLSQKGWLNAIPYSGMILSGLVAGFMVDTFGRRIFFVGSYIFIAISCFVAGSSQNFWTLSGAKFVEGVAFNFAFVATLSMFSELHHKGIRDKIVLMLTVFIAFSQIVIIIEAWAILPNAWNFVVIEDYLVLRSWNILLYVAGIWAVTTGVLNFCIPESPKFLVSRGRYDEALDVLKRIYVRNTGKSADTFPYSFYNIDRKQSLNDSENSTFKAQLSKGLKGLKPLSRSPLCWYLILIATLMFMTMLTYNTMRLWFPQISTMVENYNKSHNTTDRFCVIIEDFLVQQKNKVSSVDQNQPCVPVKNLNETYINSIINSTCGMLPIILSALLVNKIGKKLILLFSFTCGSAMAIGLYWSRTRIEIVIPIMSMISFSQLPMPLLQAYTVDIFPTSVRSIAIAIMMTVGRIGTLKGNVLFPVMLSFGCMLSFFTLAGISICAAFMTILLPSKKK